MYVSEPDEKIRVWGTVRSGRSRGIWDRSDLWNQTTTKLWVPQRLDLIVSTDKEYRPRAERDQHSGCD
jgi:hypothetical protein